MVKIRYLKNTHNKENAPMLTAAKVKSIKPTGVTKRYTDEKSMYLEVTKSGGMYWRYRYRLDGKQNIFTIGSHPELTLAQARSLRNDANKLVKQGINPTQAKKQTNIVQSSAPTFETVANEWLEDRKGGLAELTHKKNQSLLVRDVFPVIGNMPIDTIKSKTLVEMAKRVEDRGAIEMAKKAVRLCGAILTHAKVLDLIEANPAIGITDVLKKRKVQHMARIPEYELPELLRKIEDYSGELMTKIALKLLFLTFVRTNELRHMEWTEINFEKKEWRIEADKMKMSRAHIVPLSRQAIELLEEMKQHTAHRKYVFHSVRSGKPMSENTMLGAFWRMGYKGSMTGHGVRGLASTMLHERRFDHAAVELQLAHSAGNQVSAAYNHATHLEYRHEMMQSWADILDEMRVKNSN